jgi:hypothetical protein
MNNPLDPENSKIAVEVIVEADQTQLERIKANIQKESRGLIAFPIVEPYGSSKWRITFDLIGRQNTHLQPEDVGDWVLAAGLQTVKNIELTILPLQ